MTKVRVRFSKTGTARFISHLDLMRYFTRALRRARMPVWYTEGFNPHPYINFAAPLSLGFEGLCECFDMKITEEIPLERIKDDLNRVMTDGISIIKVTFPVFKTSETAFSDYTIIFNSALDKELVDFFSKDEIIIMKKGKDKKYKEIDVKPDIRQFIAVCEGEKTVLRIILPSSPVKNINPGNIMESFCYEYAVFMPEIVRNGLLSEKSGELISFE